MRKQILITGSGSGIGKDAAFALSRRGHRLIATTETEIQADELKKEVSARRMDMDVFKLDITSESEREIIKDFDLDVLINNAGIGESGCLAEIDMDRVRKNFEVNVFSALELSQIALEKMFKRNSGTVLFISSLGGRVVLPFLGPYCMTKFALSSGAESMRTEVHRVRKNVHISLVEPGAYHTGFNQKNIAKKYEWMDENSIFYPILKKIRKEEDRQFKFTELKSTQSIVKQIIKAAEATKPGLRYTAPKWQAWGTQVLRIFGK